MESNEFIEKKVKLFLLVQVKKIIRDRNYRLFEFDESKKAFCLGIIIDDLAVALAQRKIYPIFNYSNETELNTYYLYETYDYGAKIPTEDGYFIQFLEEPEQLKKQYQDTIEWYQQEVDGDKNIINFQKAKAKRYGRSEDV